MSQLQTSEPIVILNTTSHSSQELYKKFFNNFKLNFVVKVKKIIENIL
jgi:hypothetical protein